MVKMEGKIQLIIGPMWAEKTSELIRRCRRYKHAGKKCVMVKYIEDRRYSEDFIVTHDGNKYEAIACKKLEDIKHQLDILDYDVMGIDEGQFYDDIVEFCEEMANEGKIVIVAALDGTFERKPFKRILELVPLCEDVMKLSGVCMKCGKEASFTRRNSANQGDNVKIIDIGGSDKYMCVCRKCYNI